MNSPFSALVVGDINVDLGLSVEAFPVEGGDAQARSGTIGSGGGGVNASVALAALGTEVALVGCVGRDPLAEIALATPRQRGVGLGAVRSVAEARTGTCVVVTTPSGERTLFSHRGANCLLAPDCLPKEPLTRYGLILLSGYSMLTDLGAETCQVLLGEANKCGIPTALDLGLAVVRARRELLLALLPQVGLLILNESELLGLANDQSVERALAGIVVQQGGVVALKRGQKGCALARGQEVVKCSALTVEAIDSTACGDAFAAGCSFAWAQGEPLSTCGRLGNQLGGFTATRAGAAEAIPSRQDAERIFSTDAGE